MTLTPRESEASKPGALGALRQRVRAVLPLLLFSLSIVWLSSSLLDRWLHFSSILPYLTGLVPFGAFWFYMFTKPDEDSLRHEVLTLLVNFSVRFSAYLWTLFAIAVIAIAVDTYHYTKPVLLIVPGKEVLRFFPETGHSSYSLSIGDSQAKEFQIAGLLRQIIAVAPDAEALARKPAWKEKIMAYAHDRMPSSLEIMSRLTSTPARFEALSLSQHSDLRITLFFQNDGLSESWIVYQGRASAEDGVAIIFLENAWNDRKENPNAVP